MLIKVELSMFNVCLKEEEREVDVQENKKAPNLPE